MIRRLALAGLVALWPALAFAQFATIGPTPATSDNGDRLATTAWVNLFAAGSIPLQSGKIFIGSGGNLAVGQTPSGDCTLSLTGVITCTQAAGNFQVIGNLIVGGSIIDGNGILFTNIVAPATPGAGTTRGYVDSTTKRLSDKNDAGTVGNTVVASLAVANQFMTGISAVGVITRAQPAFTDISGSAACAQLPALTGNVTSSACATTIGANQVARTMEAQGIARSVIGVTGNATANVADIQGAANQFLGVNNAGTALVFSSIPNAALLNSATTIAGQTCALGSTCGLSVINNSLVGAVTMTTQNTYYDGPSVAQGSTGTWFASGNATVSAVAANNQVLCKLWDGTTVIDSGTLQPSNSLNVTIPLSGYLASPAGNLRISCTNASASGGTIATTNGIDAKASTISAFRIQ